MNWQLLWLWFWYTIGALVYMAKRAFYSISPPNPVATGWGDYIRRAGIPILFRFIVESCIYWICFSPFLLATFLNSLGWEKFSGTVAVITKFAPCALAFGLLADFVSDWFIGTVVSKITFLNLKDWWPQMPGPLPQPAIVQAELVQTQTTRTALETTTTVIPEVKP